MKSPKEILERALNLIGKEKSLKGEFIVNVQYEQGPLPIQKCAILTIYYKEGPSVLRLYRWRACAVGGNIEESNDEACSDAIAGLILNWYEIWNLINTKPQ